jgi:hypothetical protein
MSAKDVRFAGIIDVTDDEGVIWNVNVEGRSLGSVPLSLSRCDWWMLSLQ